MIIATLAELVPPLAGILPHTIGPYMTLMVVGFIVGISGHIFKFKLMIGLGIAMIFLATFLFPLALNLTTETPPEVLDYPPQRAEP